MIFSKLFLAFCLAAVVKSTELLDEFKQKNLDENKYCQATKSCAEGTHVMCLYYKPDSWMGPSCEETQNVTLNTETEELLQDIINQIRSKMANGEEIGKNGQKLPKAFGMMRLLWDEELAMFAQVWANQCMAQLDMCRATSRFERPGQVLNIVRFSHPEWNIVSTKPPYLDEIGFTENKMRYAVETAVKTTYSQKNKVTKDMLANFPDLNELANLASIRGYMVMIYSGVTHVGCAMSTYLDYFATETSHKVTTYNYVEIVCNFSGEPKPGDKIISTERLPGSSEKCGCPPGTQEDDDCLCVPIPAEEPDSGEKMTICDKEDPGCEPSVILLPIITVENAPPEKLYKPRLRVSKDSLRIGSIRTSQSSFKDMSKSFDDSSDDDFLDSEVSMPNRNNFPPALIQQLSERFGAIGELGSSGQKRRTRSSNFNIKNSKPNTR